jgi:hypothetical protein
MGKKLTVLVSASSQGNHEIWMILLIDVGDSTVGQNDLISHNVLKP